MTAPRQEEKFCATLKKVYQLLLMEVMRLEGQHVYPYGAFSFLDLYFFQVWDWIFRYLIEGQV